MGKASFGGSFDKTSKKGKENIKTTLIGEPVLAVEDLPDPLGDLFDRNVQGIAAGSGGRVDPRSVAGFNAQGILDQLRLTGENFDPFATSQHKAIQNIADTSKVIPGSEQAILDIFGDDRIFDPDDPVTQDLISATTRPIDRRLADDMVALEKAAARSGQAVGSRRFLGDALLRSRASEDKTDITSEILSTERARIEENKLNALISALQTSPNIENARFFGADRQNAAAAETTRGKLAQIEANRIAAAVSENKRLAEQAEFDAVYNARAIERGEDFKRNELLNQAIQVALSGSRRPTGTEVDRTFSEDTTKWGVKGSFSK